MDFMPDREFHPIFNRLSRKLDLKGAGTPAEINKRLNHKINEYKLRLKKKQLKPTRAKRLISDLWRLIFAGFGRRTIAR